MQYNGDGVLVQAGATVYTQDLAAPLSQVLSDGSSTYLYGQQRLAALTGSDRSWHLHDGLGSLRQLVDDNSTPLVPAGLSFSPFGLPQSGALPAPFGFTGELHHGGLQYLRARWYDPGEGVLLGRDPFAGFERQPYSLHPYQYGYSNPVLYVDPTGEQVCIAEWVPLIGQEGCVPILVTHTDTVLDGTQLALDGAGLFPLFGEAADGLNGCISLARGNLGDASLSFTAMVPFAGWGAAASKWGLRYGDEVAGAVRRGDEWQLPHNVHAAHSGTGGGGGTGRVRGAGQGRVIYDALNDGDVLSADEVLEAGDAFVGPNPIQQADGVFISRQPVDGTDVHARFRITDEDLSPVSGNPHANFELVHREVAPGTGRVRYSGTDNNKHIYISDP